MQQGAGRGDTCVARFLITEAFCRISAAAKRIAALSHLREVVAENWRMIDALMNHLSLPYEKPPSGLTPYEQ